MNKPFVNLPIDKEDLRSVSTALAPYYKMTPEKKEEEIRNVIRSTYDGESFVETLGFIAVVTCGKIKVMIGNHMLHWVTVKHP